MACRAGITTQPQERKAFWQRKHPLMRNWQLTTAFLSRKEAQAWEDRQYSCEKSGGGSNPDTPAARWYGYRFDF